MNALGYINKLSTVDARIVLQDLYETRYGIYNHMSKSSDRPLASVAMHESEDINNGSLLEEALRTYANRGIERIFKLSVLEYLDLPIDIAAMMLEIADEDSMKKSNTVDSIERQFQASIK